MKRLFLCLLFFFYNNLLFSHGFAPSTLVLLANETHESLGTLCNQLAKKKLVKIASSDHCHIVYSTIKYGGYGEIDCYIRLDFDDNYDETSPDIDGLIKKEIFGCQMGTVDLTGTYKLQMDRMTMLYQAEK